MLSNCMYNINFRSTAPQRCHTKRFWRQRHPYVHHRAYRQSGEHRCYYSVSLSGCGLGRARGGVKIIILLLPQLTTGPLDTAMGEGQ